MFYTTFKKSRLFHRMSDLHQHGAAFLLPGERDGLEVVWKIRPLEVQVQI